MKGRRSLKQSLDGCLFSQSPCGDGGLVAWSGFKRNSDLSHLVGHRSESRGGENIQVGSIVQSRPSRLGMAAASHSQRDLLVLKVGIWPCSGNQLVNIGEFGPLRVLGLRV